jgi:hypothetical protein
VDLYNETDVINFLCKRYNLEYVIEPPQEINKLEPEPEPNNNEDEPIPEVNEDSESNNEINNDIDFLDSIFNINYEEENWYNNIYPYFTFHERVNQNTDF